MFLLHSNRYSMMICAQKTNINSTQRSKSKKRRVLQPDIWLAIPNQNVNFSLLLLYSSWPLAHLFIHLPSFPPNLKFLPLTLRKFFFRTSCLLLLLLPWHLASPSPHFLDPSAYYSRTRADLPMAFYPTPESSGQFNQSC